MLGDWRERCGTNLSSRKYVLYLEDTSALCFVEELLYLVIHNASSTFAWGNDYLMSRGKLVYFLYIILRPHGVMWPSGGHI